MRLYFIEDHEKCVDRIIAADGAVLEEWTSPNYTEYMKSDSDNLAAEYGLVTGCEAEDVSKKILSMYPERAKFLCLEEVK